MLVSGCVVSLEFDGRSDGPEPRLQAIGLDDGIIEVSEVSGDNATWLKIVASPMVFNEQPPNTKMGVVLFSQRGFWN